MVAKDSSSPSYFFSTPAISRHVARVDVSTAGVPCTIYRLKPDLTREQRLEVLREVRQFHAQGTISCIGCEIAAFSLPDRA